MENLKANIAEWEKKALDLSQRLAQFNRIKDKVDRQKTLYDRLTNSLKDVNVSQVVDGGDLVGIMESATAPISVRPGLVRCLLIGFGLAPSPGWSSSFSLTGIDDRMASFTEFQHYFYRRIFSARFQRRKARARLLSCNRTTPGMSLPSPIATSARHFLHALRRAATQDASRNKRRA
jgi:hypothetical protein